MPSGTVRQKGRRIAPGHAGSPTFTTLNGYISGNIITGSNMFFFPQSVHLVLANGWLTNMLAGLQPPSRLVGTISFGPCDLVDTKFGSAGWNATAKSDVLTVEAVSTKQYPGWKLQNGKRSPAHNNTPQKRSLVSLGVDINVLEIPDYS